MTAAGRAAYERRLEEPDGADGQTARLRREAEERLRSDAPAWRFFSSQPQSCQRAALGWVASAKRAETRERRLSQLVADSVAGRTIRPLTRP